MIKLLITLIVLGLAVIGGYALYNSPLEVTGSIVNELEELKNKEMKTFVLTGENFKFVMNGVDNPEIRVNEGDKVRIEFTSTWGLHDWVVDEFGAATERVINGGESTYVEFIADKKGTFEYYCSVGTHRANGMKGIFVVE